MRLIKLLTLLLITILSLFVTRPVLAGFGVSPAEIYNDSLKPGSKFEKEIVLSRSSSDENLRVSIETDLNETESWVKFEPGKEFIFPKGQNRKTVKVIVSVPNNAELKNYKGLLRIKASSVDSSTSGVSIVQGARMEVTLVTTSINVDILNIKGLNIPNVDIKNPIKLLVNIENSGNTEASPSKIVLEIQDLTKNVIETQEVTKLEKVSPNTTKEITAEFKNNLNGGEYFGIVKVYLGDKLLRSDRLVFKVNGSKDASDKDQQKGIAFIKKLVDLAKNNKAETAAIVLIPLFPVAVGLFLAKKLKSPTLKVIFVAASIGYLVIAFALTNAYHQKRQLDMAKPGDVGNVKGETVEITPTEIPKPNPQSNLVIDKKTATYQVYRIPDLNSPVVYSASENEKLSVISETEGWYQVQTGNGTGGWLPKTSVKKTE